MFTSKPPTCTGRTLDLPRKHRDIRYLRHLGNSDIAGKTVDRRADIWAFGCVLYEMLTGSRSFDGGDVTDTIAAVVRAEPNWSSLPVETPAHMQTLLRRCLQKDLQKRLPHIGVARIEIDEGATPSTLPPGVVSPVTAGPRPYGWITAGVLLLSTLTLGAVLYLGDGLPDASTVRLILPPPQGLTFAPGGRESEGGYHPLAISPDGRHVAFVAANAEGSNTLWIRSLDSDTAAELPGTDGAAAPFWSPDSRFVAFFWVYPGFPTLFWGLSGFFVNDLMGKALWSSWKTRSVFQGAVGAFCASTAPSASTGPICMRQDRRVLGLQSTRE